MDAHKHAKIRRRRDANRRAAKVGWKRLRDDFIANPFTVFDTRVEWWRERKTRWLNLRIQSDLGRGKNLLRPSETLKKRQPGTSTFDPVLCEFIVLHYSPPGGTVLDSFAGGSVRGVVAGKLGRRYRGIELRAEQVDANIKQAKRIIPDGDVCWAVGDALDVAKIYPDLQADLLFSCPPYFDLEKYSDDARDLSNMSWPDFLAAYRETITQCCSLLRPGAHAVFVVGEVRDNEGDCRGLVEETIGAFRHAGLTLHNDAILVGAYGSAALRARQIFSRNKTLVRVHQHVLMFRKR